MKTVGLLVKKPKRGKPGNEKPVDEKTEEKPEEKSEGGKK